MSEHRTTAEWRKYGEDYLLDPDAILSDLAATEAERDDAKAQLVAASIREAGLRTALESIAKNSCCEPCREAGLVAKAALLAAPGDGVGEKIVAVLRDATGCGCIDGMPEVANALLAELGGKK